MFASAYPKRGNDENLNYKGGSDMGYTVWEPLTKIDTSKYLYHYTSMETACKILYYRTLRFSSLSSTNDIFEQRSKIIFEHVTSSNIDIANFVREYLACERKKIKILCFSQDTELNLDEQKAMCMYLSRDQIRANVTGRGFALPRMWAQYAENSRGVCLIFNKQKLLESLSKQSIINTPKSVEYINYYFPYRITEGELIRMYELINSSESEVLNELISEDSGFGHYNFFCKLCDWSSENEFRIITAVDNPSDIIEVSNIGEFIEGVVIGHNVDEMHESLISSFISPKFDVRRLTFEDMITTVRKVNLRKER